MSYIIVSPFPCAASFGRILMLVTQIGFIGDGMIKRESRKEKLTLCCRRSSLFLFVALSLMSQPSEPWAHDQLVPDPERRMPTYAHRHTFSTPPEITDLFF